MQTPLFSEVNARSSASSTEFAARAALAVDALSAARASASAAFAARAALLALQGGSTSACRPRSGVFLSGCLFLLELLELAC